MHACIYARTCRREKQHHTTNLANQLAFCLDLAHRHNLVVSPEYIFTDAEMGGDLPPTCWAEEGQSSRPALSAMVEAIESGRIRRIFVRHMEKLGTTSAVLAGLKRLFETHQVRILITPEEAERTENPSGCFALSMLRSCVQVLDYPR